MLKQRFRERSESWMSSTSHPAPASPSLHHSHRHHHSNQAITTTVLDPIPHPPPVSILTSHLPASNSAVLPPQQQQQLSPPVSTESLTGAVPSTSGQERPRKKLSFRDPEVMSTGAGSNKDATASTPVTPQLAQLKDQGFSDSMENMDLEVNPIPILVYCHNPQRMF